MWETFYGNSYRLASEFLENLDVKNYWRNPKMLFKVMGWEVIEYKKSDWSQLSTEAYSSYKDNKLFILYCSENYKSRTNYNLHHEGGHIIAAHPIIHRDTLFKSARDTEKKFLETEATIIGRNVFLPAKIIMYILENLPSKFSKKDVKRYFVEKYELSWEYVNTRFDFLEKDLKYMVYPKWIYQEEVKEYARFSTWVLKNNIKRS